MQAGEALHRSRASRSSSARRRRRFRSARSSPTEIDYLPADEEEEHVVAQANAPLDDGRATSSTQAFAPRPVALPGPVPAGAAGPDRVHGRVAQAGRLRRDRAHPVPRARRREPRPHGLEHAAPGGAAPRAGSADRRHGHGGARRARLRPGRRRPPGRRRHERHRRADPDRDGRRRARRVPRSRSSSARNQGTCINQRPIVDVGRARRRGRRRSPIRARRRPASSRSAGTSSRRS